MGNSNRAVSGIYRRHTGQEDISGSVSAPEPAESFSDRQPTLEDLESRDLGPARAAAENPHGGQSDTAESEGNTPRTPAEEAAVEENTEDQ